jgi:hypothetical protein
MSLSLTGLGPILTFRENEANDSLPRFDPDVSVGLRLPVLAHRLSIGPGIGVQDRVIPNGDFARGLIVTDDEIFLSFRVIATWNFDSDVPAGTRINFVPGTSAAAIEAVIESLRYFNISDTPPESRQLTVTLTEIVDPLGIVTNSVTVPVTVRVIAENDAPAISDLPDWQVAEGSIGASGRLTVSDRDDDPVTVTLEGPDAALLRIDGDRIVFAAPPDFETPRDADGDNRYVFTLVADDGTAETRRSLAVTVTNRPETPSLTGLPPFLALAENPAPAPLLAGGVFTQGEGLAGSRLLVGGLLPEDRVTIASTGGLAFDAATGAVRFAGDLIGTATGGQGGTFSVLLTAAANGEAMPALLSALRYTNASENPTLLRTLTLDLLGAGGPLGPAQPLRFAATPVTTQLTFAEFQARFGPSVPNLGDVDGDGVADTVGERGALPETFELVVLRGSPNGAEPFPDTGLPRLTLASNSAFPGLADMDGDGRLDVIVLRPGPGLFALDTYLNITPGPLGIPVIVSRENDLPTGPLQRDLTPWASGAPLPVISPSTLLQGWTDADGDRLTITDITLVTPRGTLGTTTLLGTRVYTPEPGDSTEAVFRYTVSDGKAAVTALAILDLLPVNAAPTGALALRAEGGLLLADAAAIRDADGLGPLAITWERQAPGAAGWDAVPGASGPGFAAPSSVLPMLYRAVATYTDGEGTAERVVSEAALVGGGRPQALTATGGVVVLDGRGGNDALTAGTGNETLLGGTGDDTLSGLGGNDRLDGQAGNDRLDGGAGNDTLLGSRGADVLTGGADDDLFFYANRHLGGDTVTDFTPGEDLFGFAAAAFGRLTPGALDPQRFALDAPDARGPQFVFDTASATLFFDPDGTGARPAIAIATLTNGVTLGAADIAIFA